MPHVPKKNPTPRRCIASGERSLRKLAPIWNQRSQTSRNISKPPAEFPRSQGDQAVRRRRESKTLHGILAWRVVRVRIRFIKDAQLRTIHLTDPVRPVVQTDAEEAVVEDRPGLPQIGSAVFKLVSQVLV